MCHTALFSINTAADSKGTELSWAGIEQAFFWNCKRAVISKPRTFYGTRTPPRNPTSHSTSLACGFVISVNCSLSTIAWKAWSRAPTLLRISTDFLLGWRWSALRISLSSLSFPHGVDTSQTTATEIERPICQHLLKQEGYRLKSARSDASSEKEKEIHPHFFGHFKKIRKFGWVEPT